MVVCQASSLKNKLLDGAKYEYDFKMVSACHFRAPVIVLAWHTMIFDALSLTKNLAGVTFGHFHHFLKCTYYLFSGLQKESEKQAVR